MLVPVTELLRSTFLQPDSLRDRDTLSQTVEQLRQVYDIGIMILEDDTNTSRLTQRQLSATGFDKGQMPVFSKPDGFIQELRKLPERIEKGDAPSNWIIIMDLGFDSDGLSGYDALTCLLGKRSSEGFNPLVLIYSGQDEKLANRLFKSEFAGHYLNPVSETLMEMIQVGSDRVFENIDIMTELSVRAKQAGMPMIEETQDIQEIVANCIPDLRDIFDDYIKKADSTSGESSTTRLVTSVVEGLLARHFGSSLIPRSF